MRILHVRPVDERQGPARPQPAPDRRRGARRAHRQYLPLLELQSLRRVGACGRLSRLRDGAENAMTPLRSVGHAATRIDALQRVTGTASYTGDIHLPGMLYARVLRSPHAHARIRRIDTSKALALPGVKAILTRENCDVVWSSGDTRNKRFL